MSILSNPKNAIIKQYQNSLQWKNPLEFEESALKAIVEKAKT